MVLCGAMAVTGHASTPAAMREVERQTLDLGHRGSRGGPVATLPDGTLLWITSGPEAPWTAPVMWPITRLTIRRSADNGKSWGEAQDFAHGSKNWSVLSHGLKRSATGALVHIFSRYSGYDYKTGLPANSKNEAFVHRSVDEGRTWTEPVRLDIGERYVGDVLSIEQLRDGRLIYPFAYLTDTKAQFACSVLYSDDDGLTWHQSRSHKLEAGGGGFESGASEPTVVELPDGRLWMLLRAQTGFLWESYSTDRGETWSTAQPSPLPSSNAPATALRLRNGDIAVAWNNHVQFNYARQSLVLGLTRDGRSFRAVREIDFTDYPDNDDERVLHVTYPYLTETRDGLIAVSYNKGHWMRHNRPALALVDPAWLRARQETVDFRDGRIGWHTVNPGPKRSAAVERYVSDPETGSLALELEPAPQQANPAGIVRNIPLVADGEVQVTVAVVRPEAYLLFGDTLLDPRNVAEGCVRIRLAGEQAFLAAGRPQQKTNAARATEFHYSSHAIQAETPYPAPIKPGETLVISLKYQAGQKKAMIRINGGPGVELATGEILGLSYVGLVAGKDGALRLLSIRTQLN
jgi:predicted neuraminidase